MSASIEGKISVQASKAFAEIDRVIGIEVEQAVLKVERRAKQNLTDLEKVDRGFVRNSIDHKVQVKKGRIEGVTFAGAKHARWVHEGRLGTKSSPAGTNPKTAATAAFPNLKAIEQWVRRNNTKLKVSGVKSRGKNKGQTRAAKGKDVKSAAFAIALKIKREGIAPTPFLRSAFLTETVGFKKRVLAAINKVVIK